MDWLDFPEPGESEESGGYPYNGSPDMETTAAALGLTDERREVALAVKTGPV